MKICKYGHKLTKGNVYIERMKRGKQCFIKRCLVCNRRRMNSFNANLKIEVLAHYGLNGKLQCCWPGCEVNDIDMLTLDHINNDGAKHRRSISIHRERNCGSIAYRNAKKQGFPNIFQTLCWNHQCKKEMLKRRENRMD